MFRYHWSIVIGLISVGTLLGALILQYGFDVAPCKLCYQQRYLWLATLVTACIAWLFRHKKHYQIFFLIIVALLLLGSFSIGIYQTGTIYSWWSAVIACEASSINFDALNAFDPQNIENLSFTPSCSNADQLVFGIPIPLLNAFIAIICMFYIAFYTKILYFKQVE